MNLSIITTTQKHKGIIYSKILNLENSFIVGRISYENQCPKSATLISDVFYEPITLVYAKEAIETMLLHIKTHYPTITEITFCDNHYVDADFPLYLYALYIVYNNKTWYELYFNGRMECPKEYEQYRERIRTVFQNSETKPANYIDFLCINPAIFELKDELEIYYKSTSTYSEFFHSIPLEKRRKLVYPIINFFIKHYIVNDVFNFCSNWIMPINQTVNKYIVDKCVLSDICITHQYSYHYNVGVSMDDV
jgi:hypothetical protein